LSLYWPREKADRRRIGRFPKGGGRTTKANSSRPWRYEKKDTSHFFPGKERGGRRKKGERGDDLSRRKGRVPLWFGGRSVI